MAKTAASKKKLRVWIILLILAAILAAAAIILLPKIRQAKSEYSMLTYTDTTVLKSTDLESTISATGIVESASSKKVYSALSYLVEEVCVEVGDEVREGQLLCRLDGESIENQIESQRIGMQTAQDSASAQMQSAWDNYSSFKTSLDQGLNSTLLSAQTQADNALRAYHSAEDAYNRYRQGLENGENTTLISAESALDNARMARRSAEQALDDYDEALYPMTSRDTLEQQYDSAQRACESAQASYDAAYNAVYNQLADLETAMQSAWDAYQAALVAKDAAQKGVDDQLRAYADTVNTAQSASSTAVSEETIRQLEKTLEDTKITAPCSGTVTAVYAEVGASGSGLLFVIEDTKNLIVETTVKGYDLGNVSEGMRVQIRSDATGEARFDGEITTIAPTARKTAYGTTDLSGDAVFETEVAVSGQDTGLRIGMEAQLDFILAQAENVLTAPYDAVYENDAGQSVVLCATEQEDGTWLLSELPVITGASDDLDIVISGDGVCEGLRIVNVPESMRSYVGKTVTIGDQSIRSVYGAYMLGGMD